MAGRELLQIPGPSNVPRRVLEAIARPTIDHRGPEFADTVKRVELDLQRVIRTRSPVVIYPASGTGAWEAALVNTLSPGDAVLHYETGHFAYLWSAVARRVGLDPIVVGGDWRRGAVAEVIGEELRRDAGHRIKAVCVVHNETSTGAVSDIRAVRQAMDGAQHPALLMVDTISSLASIDYGHDELGVDVTVAASQKGLMLPPGLSFNVIGPRALDANAQSKCPRSYWDWAPMLESLEKGMFPFTPATNLIVGLAESLSMILDEGLESVFFRHQRLAEVTRACVKAWGLELQCIEAGECSNVLTAVRLPDGHDADGLRAVIRDRFGVTLGNGLGKLAGRVFRIGHLGDFNETMLVGTLSAVEMGLRLTQVPLEDSGLPSVIDLLVAQGTA